MSEPLKIFTEQLKHDDHQQIELSLSSDFLDLHEKEISTPSPIHLKGEAYIVDDLLMLEFEASTEVQMPCSVCNAPTLVPLQNKNIFISIPLSELPSSVFDYSGLLREELVMLLPQFIECEKGACPHRQELKPYLKTDQQPTSHNFPFADLHSFDI